MEKGENGQMEIEIQKKHMKTPPHGSKLPQGPFLLIKNIVMEKALFEYFKKKWSKQMRNEILYRSVVLMSQIDRKSYQL